jgi:hypothetical protein
LPGWLQLLEPEILERGREIRRKVLGITHVEGSCDLNELSRP